jgi:hypothetical protein
MAKQQNIIIDQGTDIVIVTTVLDANGELMNLSDYTATSKIRKHYQSNTAISFTCDINANNEITMALTNIQTDAIDPGRYVFDLEIKNSANIISRILEGICTVKPSVTY